MASALRRVNNSRCTKCRVTRHFDSTITARREWRNAAKRQQKKPSLPRCPTPAESEARTLSPRSEDRSGQDGLFQIGIGVGHHAVLGSRRKCHIQLSVMEGSSRNAEKPSDQRCGHSVHLLRADLPPGEIAKAQ